MFSQEDINPCTLLLNVDNELKDVARGSVLMPENRSFHFKPMDDSVHRVRVDRSLPGCGDLDPPSQPPDADSELKVGQLKNHILLWPKALIRLNTAASGSGAPSQARVTPASVPAASQDRASPPPADDPLEHENAMDIDRAPIDSFIDDLEADVPPSEAPARDTLKKKLFPSQETPEQEDYATAFTAPPQAQVTPRTLLGVTMEAMKQTGTPACNKKGRKRKKRPGQDAASNPVVRVDRLPTPWRTMHHLGEPMLPQHIVSQMTPDLRSLHDIVLFLEQELLKDTNPSYPVFTVRVPTNLGFVTTYPFELFFIRYEDVFRLFHMSRLDRNLVRLVSLSMAHDIIVEKTPHIAIMDPVYMTTRNTEKEHAFVATYIKDFLVANKDKECFLMPYFPE